MLTWLMHTHLEMWTFKSRHSPSPPCAKPVVQACGLTTETGALTPFNCSDTFCAGRPSCGVEDVSGILLFTSSSLAEKITFKAQDLNPFYFATWAMVQTNDHLVGQEDSPLETDPEIVMPIRGGMAWILSCNATVYDLTYTWINGTMNDMNLPKSNKTTGRIFAAPFPYKFAPNTLGNAAIVSFFS
jgi:hypothetical protein